MRSVKRLIELAQRGRRFRGWYDRVRSSIAEVCARKGWDEDRFIDILALTSPRIQTRRNMKVTIEYMDTGDIKGGLIPATRAALSHYEASGEIRGQKTSAFASAIRGDKDSIVLDVWMAVAFEIDQREFGKVSIRNECKKRIARAATTLGWTNAEVQAAVWSAAFIERGRRVPQLDTSELLIL